MTLDTSEYEKSLSSAGNKATSFGSGIKSTIGTAVKVAAGAVTAAGAGIVAFGKSAVSAGSQFDTSMSQVAATMGTTVDSIENLREFAMDMGATTAFSATQAADALNYMALAGYDAEESMQALPTVLDLAAAGGMDLATASDMVTDAQSALGLTMEESAEMVDKMAMASSKSNTSVSQLGEAILTIGGTAKNLAGGTTELSTALGILADNGIKGAEGGTHLRNVILSLMSPTDDAAATLDNLGVSVFDAEGNMRSMNDILGDLNASMENMTSEQKQNAISKIFNKTDLSAVNALLTNTGDRWNELSGYIDDAAGAASKMANTQLDNLTGDVTLFKSALEGAQIQVSDKLTPALREFVQFGTDGLTRVADAFSEDGLSGAMDAFGDVVGEGLNKLIEGIPEMVTAGAQLLGAVGEGIARNIPELATAAFEAVVALGGYIIDNLPEIWNTGKEIATELASGLWESLDSAISESAVGDVWASIKESASGAADEISDAFGRLKEAFQPVIDKITEIKDNFTAYASEIDVSAVASDALSTAISGIADVLVTVIDGVAQFVGWLTSGSTGAEAFKTVLVALVALFGTYQAATMAVTAAQTALNLAQNILKAGQIALNAVMSLNPFSLVAAAVVALVAAITYLWNTNDGFREAVTTAWEAIKSTAETVFNSVAGFFTETIPEAIDTALEFFDNLMNGSRDDMNAIELIVSTVLNNIKTIFSTITGAIKGVVSAFTAALNGDWDGAMNALKDTASTVWEGIKTVIGNKIDLVKNLVSNGLDAVKGFFSDKLGAAKDTVSSKFDSIKSAISDKMTAAKTAVQGAIDAIKAKFNFSWSLPSLKLPHISISGSFSINPPSVPRFSIAWYKKAMDIPMILSGATIFGAMGGNFLGGGESGSEIVAGQETLMNMIRDATGADETNNLLRKFLSTSSATPTQIIVNGSDYSTTMELAQYIAQLINRDTQRRGAALAY